VQWPVEFSELMENLQIFNLQLFKIPAVGCMASINFLGESE
jgi:hypothetical protein